MNGRDALAAGALAAMLVLSGTQELPWWDITGGPPFSLMATTLVPRGGVDGIRQRPREERPKPAPKGAVRKVEQ